MQKKLHSWNSKEGILYQEPPRWRSNPRNFHFIYAGFRVAWTVFQSIILQKAVRVQWAVVPRRRGTVTITSPQAWNKGGCKLVLVKTGNRNGKKQPFNSRAKNLKPHTLVKQI